MTVGRIRCESGLGPMLESACAFRWRIANDAHEGESPIKPARACKGCVHGELRSADPRVDAALKLGSPFAPRPATTSLAPARPLPAPAPRVVVKPALALVPAPAPSGLEPPPVAKSSPPPPPPPPAAECSREGCETPALPGQKYCSRKCCTMVAAARHRGRSANPKTERKCALSECDVMFTPAHGKIEYHSPSCQDRASYLRWCERKGRTPPARRGPRGVDEARARAMTSVEAADVTPDEREQLRAEVERRLPQQTTVYLEPTRPVRFTVHVGGLRVDCVDVAGVTELVERFSKPVEAKC